MLSSLKYLGILFSMVAINASMASDASAAVFTASSYPATFTASNVKGAEVFHTEAGNMECDSRFEGTETEASSTATVHPTYTNCEFFGGLSATVSTAGCDYLFHLTSTSNAKTDIVCGATPITITAGTCKVEIKGQAGLEETGMAASGGEITASPNISGIAYTVTQDGFLCPYNGTGTRSGGTYVGTATFARVGGGTMGIE